MKSQLQVKILKRFMSEKNLKDLFEDYESAKFSRGGGERTVTDAHRKMLQEYLKTSNISAIARNFKVSSSVVSTGILNASIEKLRS